MIVLERKNVTSDCFNVNVSFKNTRREKTLSNEALGLVKCMNIYIRVVGTLNQLFITFSKKKVVTGKTPFFAIGLFCTAHSICLNIGF